MALSLGLIWLKNWAFKMVFSVTSDLVLWITQHACIYQLERYFKVLEDFKVALLGLYWIMSNRSICLCWCKLLSYITYHILAIKYLQYFCTLKNRSIFVSIDKPKCRNLFTESHFILSDFFIRGKLDEIKLPVAR